MHFILLFIITISDAIRDALIYRKSEITWIQYHIVKWISFFLATGYIYFLNFNNHFFNWLFPFICWGTWKLTYELTLRSLKNEPNNK